jgi:hypothetical protein
VVADFDSDTRADLAYTTTPPATVVQVVESLNGPPGTNGGAYPVPAAPGHLTTAELDGKNGLDLVVVSNGVTPSVSVLLHSSSLMPGALFGSAVSYPLPGAGAGVTVADFDRDGHPDVLVSARNGLYVLGGAANGTLLPAVANLGGAESESIAVADFDGDGRLDAAVADHAGSKVYVLRNTGSRTFAPWEQITVDRNPSAIVTADFDGDGKPDLATANQGDGTITLLLNRAH